MTVCYLLTEVCGSYESVDCVNLLIGHSLLSDR